MKKSLDKRLKRVYVKHVISTHLGRVLTIQIQKDSD